MATVRGVSRMNSINNHLWLTLGCCETVPLFVWPLHGNYTLCFLCLSFTLEHWYLSTLSPDWQTDRLTRLAGSNSPLALWSFYILLDVLLKSVPAALLSQRLQDVEVVKAWQCSHWQRFLHPGCRTAPCYVLNHYTAAHSALAWLTSRHRPCKYIR